MFPRYVVGLFALLALGVGGWVLGQQSATVKDSPATSGQFMVSPVGSTAVLLDTKSAKTWVLQRSAWGPWAWLPATRIDSEDAARNWNETQERIKRETAKAQN
jgi:hypothetical protein